MAIRFWRPSAALLVDPPGDPPRPQTPLILHTLPPIALIRAWPRSPPHFPTDAPEGPRGAEETTCKLFLYLRVQKSTPWGTEKVYMFPKEQKFTCRVLL